MAKSAWLKFFKQKVRSSSLIEVTTALVICMIIFTISMQVLLNVQTSVNVEARQRALFLSSHEQPCEGIRISGIGSTEPFKDGNLVLRADTFVKSPFKGLVICQQRVFLNGNIVVLKSSYYVKFPGYCEKVH